MHFSDYGYWKSTRAKSALTHNTKYMLTNLIIVAFQLLIHTPNPYNSEPSFLQKYVQSCCKSPLDVVEADIKFIELTAKRECSRLEQGHSASKLQQLWQGTTSFEPLGLVRFCGLFFWESSFRNFSIASLDTFSSIKPTTTLTWLNIICIVAENCGGLVEYRWSLPRRPPAAESSGQGEIAAAEPPVTKPLSYVIPTQIHMTNNETKTETKNIKEQNNASVYCLDTHSLSCINQPLIHMKTKLWPRPRRSS